MKKKYIQGMLLGAFLSFLLCGILVAGYLDTEASNLRAGVLPGKSTSSQGSGVDKLTDRAVLNKITGLEKMIDEYYLNDVDEDKMVEGIYKGMFESLGDPYSVYYTKEEFADLMESSSGSYCGIGSYVSQDIKTGIITIVKPFKDGPAYKAGMLPGDIIYKVNGMDVSGKEVSEVVSVMKGKEGTNVDVEVLRSGESSPIKMTITRKKVEVPTIEYEMLDGKIGYIKVSEFDEVTTKQFRKAIHELEEQGQKGLVIDLRDNPGGQLDTVCDMLDRMLPKGILVYQEDKTGKRIDEQNSTDKESFNKPLAVIINGNSASASEVFAGAIQDYGTGTLVGTKSFGKGIVQSVIPLRDGSGIKVTISKYFTPKGRNIHEIGIEPDVEVELDKSLRQKVQITKAEDNQLQEAVKVVKDKIK